MNTSFIATIKNYASVLCLLAVLFVSACSSDDPEKEDTPEMITQAKFTFTPNTGGAAVTVTATDPDGAGVADLTLDGPANLAPDVTYKLKIELFNTLAEANDPEYNISNEVAEEGDEHMFFFGWTNDLFGNPAGNGNIDTRTDPVNYTGDATSVDADGLPLGLVTTWTTVTTAKSGTLRILLKHQPELKSATSDSNTGETDLDVTVQVKVGS